MKKSFEIFSLILLVATLSCCNKQNRFQEISVSDIPEAKTEIIRMDKDIYQLNDCITRPAITGNYDMMTVDIPDNDSLCLLQQISKIEERYGNQYSLYLYQLGAMTGTMHINPATLFYLFLSHPAYGELFQDCEKEYENVSDLEDDFTHAFSRAKTLIPSFNIPKVCTFFSGFAEYIAADSSTIYVSLEYFLGENYPSYKHVPGIYDYMIPNLKREKIVPDALYHWICSEYPLQKEGGNLLDNMIHYGKILYTIESILPNIDKKLLIGYNQEQWEWCEQNEKGMWNYLREYNQLFSTDSKTISDYLFPANNTKYFSDEEGHNAPSQAVLWMGWKIVSEYMEKESQLSINDLLTQNKDAQSILAIAKYRP